MFLTSKEIGYKDHAPLPEWTDWTKTDRFNKLIDQLRKSWLIGEKISIFENLARYVQVTHRDPCLDVPKFTQWLRGKTNIFSIAYSEQQINKKMAEFFTDLANAGYCTIDDTNDLEQPITVSLITPASEKVQPKEDLALLTNEYLWKSYKKSPMDFIEQALGNPEKMLPNPESIADDIHHPKVTSDFIKIHAVTLSSVNLLSQSLHIPEQDPDDKNIIGKYFFKVDFSEKEYANIGHILPGFSIILPGDATLDYFIKSVFMSVLATFIKNPNQSHIRALYNAQIKTLSEAGLTVKDEDKFQILINLFLTKLDKKNILLYQMARFVLDAIIAKNDFDRQNKELEEKIKKEREIVIKTLIATCKKQQHPRSENDLGEQPVPLSALRPRTDKDHDPFRRLQIKYLKNHLDLNELLPVSENELTNPGKILNFDGKRLHRWSLIPHFDFMRTVEQRLIQNQIVKRWVKYGMPTHADYLADIQNVVKEIELTPEFIAVYQRLVNYLRIYPLQITQAMIDAPDGPRESFIDVFFPDEPSSIEWKISRPENPLEKMKEVYGLIFNDKNFTPTPYATVLALDYELMIQQAKRLRWQMRWESITAFFRRLFLYSPEQKRSNKKTINAAVPQKRIATNTVRPTVPKKPAVTATPDDVLTAANNFKENLKKKALDNDFRFPDR